MSILEDIETDTKGLYQGYWVNWALLNHHTALELVGHLLFDVVGETHQDDFVQLTIPLTHLDGGAIRALDRGVNGLCH